MRFSQIPGHTLLKSQLCEAVRRSHVSHAQLFYGTEGSMQLAMAMAFATFINCENKSETDSCGQCASCRKMDKLAHPDFHFVFPIVKTKKIKTDDSASGSADAYMAAWRDFIQNTVYGSLAQWHEQIGAEKNQQAIIPADEARKIVQKISLKAYEGNYKIMLIWLPELMNVTSANAILKILEEPPAKTIFLLVSNDAPRLLPTIISRTVSLHIPNIGQEALTEFLQNQYQIPAQRAAELADLSGGNMLEAITLHNNTDEDLFENFSGWMRYCFKTDVINLVKLADQFEQMDRSNQKLLIDYGLGMYRNILLYKNAGESLIKLEAKELDFVRKFSKTIMDTKIEAITEQLSHTYYLLERNAKPKILFLDLSLQLTRYFIR
jgi:DNA polymerase III subunit delta'